MYMYVCIHLVKCFTIHDSCVKQSNESRTTLNIWELEIEINESFNIVAGDKIKFDQQLILHLLHSFNMAIHHKAKLTEIFNVNVNVTFATK